MYNNISVERLEQIEREREQTVSTTSYQQWMRELNVSSSYVDNTYILNAREAMRHWDSSRLNINRITDECM